MGKERFGGRGPECTAAATADYASTHSTGRCCTAAAAAAQPPVKPQVGCKLRSTNCTRNPCLPLPAPTCRCSAGRGPRCRPRSSGPSVTSVSSLFCGTVSKQVPPMGEWLVAHLRGTREAALDPSRLPRACAASLLCNRYSTHLSGLPGAVNHGGGQLHAGDEVVVAPRRLQLAQHAQHAQRDRQPAGQSQGNRRARAVEQVAAGRNASSCKDAC